MKPIYIMLDNCSWIDLSQHNESEKIISQLHLWEEEGKIVILVPEQVLSEWFSNKERIWNNFKKNENDKLKTIRETLKKSGQPIPGNLETGVEKFENSLKAIEKRIESGVEIKPDTEIKAYCYERSMARKPPFHSEKKKKSNSADAIIIFSTLNFLKGNNIDELIFISSNTSDFADKKNKSRELHPELLSDFRNISVEYFSNVKEAFIHLGEQLGSSVIEFSEQSVTDDNFIFPFDKNNSIVDELHTYFSKIFNEVDILPNHILTNNYLFLNEKNKRPVQINAYKIKIENELLFNFFKSIKTKKNGNLHFNKCETIEGVNNPNSKAEFILKKFTTNYIYIFQKSHTRDWVQHIYLGGKKCNCVGCSYSKFDFSRAFKLSKKSGGNHKEQLKLAYVNYRIGNYFTSIKILLDLSEKVEKENLRVTTLIVKYNLWKLSRFIRFHSRLTDEKKLIVERLKKIDLESEFRRLVQKENRQILLWIKDNSFYERAKEDMTNQLSKIIEHYHSQLKGNWGDHTYTWDFIMTYGRCETFLNRNYIVFDKFSEFEKLTEIFIEGIFAAHAVKDSRNCKLQSFDDWTFIRMIFYGDARFIKKMFYKYRLEKLEYKSHPYKNNIFSQFTTNFLNDDKIEAVVKRYSEPENDSFWNKYNRYFENFIIIVAFTDLNKNQVNIIVKSLIHFLRNHPKVRNNFVQYLRLFISRKGNVISKINFKKLFLLIIDDSRLHDETLIIELYYQLQEGKFEILLSKIQFKNLKSAFFEKCIKCNKEHPSEVGVNLLLMLSSQEQKEQLKSMMIKSLDKNFTAELFYSAVIYGVLNSRKKWFDKFLEKSLPKNNSLSFENAMTRKPLKVYHKLNDFLNLAFKEKIDLTDEKFDKLRGISDYYDWLLDMEGFDYDKFQLPWIVEYDTSFFMKKIASVPKIKTLLVEHLKNNHDGHLERYYMNFLVHHYDL